MTGGSRGFGAADSARAAVHARPRPVTPLVQAHGFDRRRAAPRRPGFAVADAVDAITNHRPYRAARSWRDCRREIVAQRGTQFDPMVVDAFCDREYVLHEIRREFLAAA